MVRKILRSRLLRRLAKQTQGCKRVPEPLQGAIKTYLEDYPNHQLRQHVFNLSLMLSGSADDGSAKGMVPYEAPEKIMAAVEDYLTRRGPFAPVPKRFRSKRMKPKYDEKQVAAYVAARMPAVYSVVQNVLSEVRRRLPNFAPVSALDYGSGPGTAIWALSQVWPKSVMQVNMVETSPSMLAASKKILQDLESAPAMYNYKSLRVLTAKTRHSGHDIVIACYAIGELPTVSDQITAARQLWSLTRDLLVIIEPGTSEGSLTVRGIRAHILALERKKLRRRRMYLTGSDPENVPLIGMNNESEEGIENNAIQARKERMKAEAAIKSSRAGAHVVAPCPHDGVCPMDGTEQFCHFVQRLERTLTQRVAKKFSKPMLRGYEDEKYSYVVLRRGMRPSSKWPLDNVKLELDMEKEPVNELLVDYDEFNIDTDDEEATEDDDEEEELEVEGSENDVSCNSEKLEDAGEGDNKADDDYEHLENVTKEGFLDYQEDGGSETESSDKEAMDIVANRKTDEEESEENNDLEEDQEEEAYVSSEGDDGDLEESTETVANMSSGWGRVIFKPYRRGKHVTLDVCRSTERDGSAGSFDRLTVTRSKHRVLHREAKKVRWGDLWAFTSSRRTFQDNRDNRIPLYKK